MRKRKTWVVMQTSPRGEEEAKLGLLAQRLKDLSDISLDDIYVPILRGGSSKATFLIEGYIFVKSGYPSTKYYELARSAYIECMISQYDSRSDMISQGTVSEYDLRNMISEAYSRGGSYQVGDHVDVIEGDFKGCSGEVLDILERESELGGGKYSILITLRSAEVILSLDSFSVGDSNG